MIQVLVNGLMMGGIYVMFALGYTLIFGVMKIVNFAQGEFMMLGMFITMLLMPLAGNGIPYIIIPLLIIIMFILSAVVFKLTISPILGKGSYILLTVGLMYFFQYSVQMIFGPTPLVIPVADSLKYGSIVIGGITLLLPRLIAFIVSIVSVVGMTIFLNTTYLGRAMRATSENEKVAVTLGVKTRSVYIIAWSIAACITGVAGLLITPMFLAYPTVGVNFFIYATTAVVIGTLGNLPGAMVGGLLIGLVESFASTYLSFEIAPIMGHLLLLLVLMVKPEGLFGKGGKKA